ncbi:hypothetical protein [Hellea balneolensis]|uniref:hypothetical protein n=1 Tax=Hellea balneolensis TaxID=287478 RepID=UPI00040F7A4D|nr:hypothetical protein [Hellea balneolensis]
MFSRNFFAISALISLMACQSGERSKSEIEATEADIVLRATTDIQTPSPIRAATFVPNSVASWLGHIILLDNKGTLHRATTDSSETDIVALGKYDDVIGLAREKQSGVFLALTPQGKIKAFVQSDNDGNFSPLAVSQGDESFERFCASAELSGDTIWAVSTRKDVQKLTVEIFEDTSLSLSKSEVKIDDNNNCMSNNALHINENFVLKPGSSNGLVLSSDKVNKTVEITNGLSINGIKEVGLVSVTSANMGSVFNEGVVLVADENEGRLVLISRAYALNELTTP